MFPRRSLLIASGSLLASSAFATPWPQWRGPQGTGRSDETDIPVVWNDVRGRAWQVPLKLHGTTTPAIWEDAIFLTGQDDAGQLRLVRFNKTNGETVWSRNVGESQTTPVLASSPATDGKTIVTAFANGQLAAYDFAGERVWQHNLLEDYGPQALSAAYANPVLLASDLVLSAVLQKDESHLVAHDLRDGHEKWSVVQTLPRGAARPAVPASPHLLKIGDDWQLVSIGPGVIDGRDPRTGAEQWRFNLTGERTQAGAMVAQDMLFFGRSRKGPLVALKFGRDQLLDHRDLVWSEGQGVPQTCAPVAWDTHLFTITDDGLARCCDVFTGRLRWQQRLPGKYAASPVAAEGRIYFLNTAGRCTVVAASPKFDKLTENQLEDETRASIAISDGHLFVRGKKHLYCLGRGMN